jgi:hypothetical protein
MSAEMKAETRGFSRRTCGGRTIAGHADNPVLLAEQIERLDSLLGQANDAAGREVLHGQEHMPEVPRLVTAAITSEVIA